MTTDYPEHDKLREVAEAAALEARAALALVPKYDIAVRDDLACARSGLAWSEATQSDDDHASAAEAQGLRDAVGALLTHLEARSEVAAPNLSRFRIGRADVGGDPPIVCDDCEAVLCTIEPGDFMVVLARVCTDHACGVER